MAGLGAPLGPQALRYTCMSALFDPLAYGTVCSPAPLSLVQLVLAVDAGLPSLGLDEAVRLTEELLR